MQLITVPVTTDVSGDATVQIIGVSGSFLQLRYVPDGSNPLDTGADLDISGDKTGLVFVNHDDIGLTAFTRCYRQATHGTDGSASLFAAGGEPVEDYIIAHGENLTLTIASGGASKSGTFYLWFD